MALTPGVRLGPYEVLAAIGAGGMGEVYRARDTRLGRDVAVKVLPSEFTHHPERLRRFENEARAVSALNHPNILTIFDIGSHGGAPYVVFELLDGETLRQAGPLSRRKAIDYAQQIARGMAAAHDRGITHRDLKPENLFITAAGHIKILDFGLAKVAPLEAAETMSGQTQPGAVLGTAGYMSPEQVRGEEADHRSDIFSFGLILYEMLSGRRAFQAATAASTMHAILTSEPPELEHAALDRIVRHCIEKTPALRFQSARDIDFALEAAAGTSIGGVGPGAKPQRKPWASLAIAVVITVAIVTAAGYWLYSRGNSATAWTGTVLPGPVLAYNPRVSPDGRTVAFVEVVDHMVQVAVINPESGNWNVLTKDRSHGGVGGFTWSADGSAIFYSRSNSMVYRIPSLGGEERLVLENASRPESLPDGSLLVAKINAQRQSQIHRFWPQSGRLDPLPAALDDDEVMLIRAFPDGRDAVFYGRTLNPSDAQSGKSAHLYIMNVATGGMRRLDSTFSSRPPFVVTDGVHNRVLILMKSGDLHQVAWLPRSGEARPQPVFQLTQTALSGDISVDGTVYLDQYQPGSFIMRVPVSGGTPERLPGSGFTHVLARPTHPLLLEDGRALITVPFAGGSRLLVAAAGKDPQPLIQTAEETAMPAVVLPGKDAANRQLAFMLGSGAKQAIAIASLTDGRIFRRLPETAGSGQDLVHANVVSLAVSPDGQTLYYASSRNIWKVPVTGGQPVLLAPGDSVAVHPNGKKILIKLNESEPRLVWMDALTAETRPFPLHFSHGGRLSEHSLTPGSIDKNGRIVTEILADDFSFYQAALIDPTTGAVKGVPISFEGDVDFSAWTGDGRIVFLGREIAGAMWSFKPMK